MGWGHGTEIFDAVVQELKKYDVLKTYAGNNVVKALYNELRDADWDTFYESNYYKNPTIRKIVEKIEPSQYEDI